MGRRDYQYDRVLCTKGIDQQEGLADPVLTCADARNVWAPDGKVESRPGYVGIRAFGGTSQVDATNPVLISSTGGVNTAAAVGGTLVVGGLAVGDVWYFGIDDDLYTIGKIPQIQVSVLNTNDTYPTVSYWDGSEWRFLRFSEGNDVTFGYSGKHLGSNDAAPKSVNLSFAPPGDWVQTTIVAGGVSYTKYFLAFSLQNAVVSAGTAITNVLGDTLLFEGMNIRGLFTAVFPSTKRYVRLGAVSTGLPLRYASLATLDSFTGQVAAAARSGNTTEEPATIATIPQFEEAYVAYGHSVTVHKAYPTTSDDITARVEDDPALVGPDGDYAPDLVPQLATFPRAKYIEYFQGHLWAANLLDDPFSIRWAADAKGYRVWPTLNIETLMENDNSPITGIKGFQNHMTVFKNDSVWRMVDTGISEFLLQGYTAERVVNGVGCVSQSSIAEVMNRLVFLAEDGIYTYDGTSAVEKLSMRISKTIASITPGRRPFAAGVNWKSKNLYLLSVSVNGSDANNLVIVWDYKNDAFWLWDDIEAQVWLLDEDSADNEKLYFGDSKGRIYELGVGKTDHGGTIDAWLITQRQKEDHWSRRLRSVEVYTSNDTRQLSLTVIPNDMPESDLTPVTLDATHESEKDWGELVYGTDKWVQPRGRMKRSSHNKAGEWFQLKLQHNTKNTPMTIEHIQMGYVPLGRR
jgi:hypothetical protein